ncbi:MAG: VPLPA-CTERM sorting domain-containing protein [Sulfuricaulis sp.]
MNKTALSCALGLALGVAAFGAQAAAVNPGDKLTINSGNVSASNFSYSGTGSYFGMDQNNNSKVDASEKTGIEAAGAGAVIIGSTQAATGSHSGAINGSELPAFDIWEFFGNTGMDYTTVAPTGSTAAGLNLSGWTVTWNGIAAIPMGNGAWQPLNCSSLGCSGHTFTNGNAMFVWDGIYGNSYTLNYTGTVPLGDPSGFGGVKYFLHLTGNVMQASASPVPVPAAVWLFGSGLLGLVGVARRKKKA